MSFSPTAIGVLLRRVYPRAEAVIKSIIEAVQFQRTQGKKITEADVINRVIPITSKIKVEDLEENSQMVIGAGPYPTYIPATEPDGDKVKLYLFTDHLAEIYRDHSGFGNHATITYYNQIPDVDTDGLDLGNGYASRCLKFDSSRGVILTIPDNASIRITGLSVGFSLIQRVRITDFSASRGQQGRMYQKWEDGDNWITILYTESGRIEFHIEVGGVVSRWETLDPVLDGEWQTIEYIYNKTGPALTIKVDGQTKSIQTSSSNPSVNQETNSLFIGGYNQKAYISFNGTSDYLDITHQAAMSLSKFTIQVNFRTSKKYSLYGTLLQKGNGPVETPGQNVNYEMYFYKDYLSSAFETSAGWSYWVYDKTTPRKNDGFWHRAFFTYDLAMQRLYCDGVQIDAWAAPTPPDNNTINIRLGANCVTPADFFKGDISAVRIWNNNVTLAEIQAYEANGTIPQQGNKIYENLFGGEDGDLPIGCINGNIQWTMFVRDVLHTDAQALAIHNNKWTTNPDVGSNKVAMVFNTLATTP